MKSKSLKDLQHIQQKLDVKEAARNWNLTPIMPPDPNNAPNNAPTPIMPTPVLARHMERISALPKPRQKLVMQVIKSMLAQPSR